MNRHPGGKKNTYRLLNMGKLEPPCRILDAGCGEGESVSLLKEMGFDAVGADLKNGIDFLNLPFDDESFDAVISECAFFISGNQKKAIEEAFRVLKPGGKLLLADIFFEDIPFEVSEIEDITDEWKEYYLEKIWAGESICDIPEHKGKVHYYLCCGEKYGFK